MREPWLTLSFLAGSILVLSVMFRVVPLAPRRRLRRSWLLLALYGVALAISLGFASVGLGPAERGFQIAAEMLEILLVINLAALTFFDLLLFVVKWDYPDIVHDLAVGAAYLVAVGWVMHRSGVDITSIVATSAVVTAVIGLSLQATLGNVVGGLALQVDDSISEGDWIELENKVQGQVKQVRWRHTVLETRDWDTLIVPNSQLLAQTIKVLGKRAGQPSQHRIWIYFGVDFRFPPGTVIQVVNDALQAAPITSVASDPKPHCICCDFAKDHRESYAHYAVRYWVTDLASDDPVSSSVRERIYTALRRAQIPMALPASTVFVSHDDPEHAERKHSRDRAFRLKALESTDLFARLSAEEKERLADLVRLTPFSAGEIVTRQGAKAHWLYLLTKGEVEVRVTGGGGIDQRVATLKAPAFFGEMALMTGEPREATVVAMSEVDCLRLDKQDFQGILEHRPEMAQEISTVLAQRRIELLAVRDNLDAEAKKRQMISERGRILASIRNFFGLSEG